MRAIRFASSVLLLALVHSGSFQNQPGCGIPGRPLQGDYWPQKTEYKIKDTIQYDCPEGFLKGNETRRCYPTGQWSDSVPVCLRKLQGTADLNITIEPKECVNICSNGTKTNWNPHTNEKCTHSYKCKDLKIFIRSKNGNFTLDGLKLTFLKPVPPKFKAYSEHDGKTKTLCNHSSTVDDGNIDTVQLDCYSGKPSTGVLLDFQTDKDDELLSICDITLLSHLETFGCELPDAPLNGYVQQKKMKSFEFLCFPDFELKGTRSVDCNRDGTWSERSPTCVRKAIVERRINGTNEDAPCPKNCLCVSFVFVALAVAVVVLFLSLWMIIVYVRKRKSKIKAGKQLHRSSQSSNSFVIAYSHNRNDGDAINCNSTGTEYYSNPDFAQEDGERPRSDVPDILENKVLNKVTAQTKRGAIPSAHIYADPVYSEMEDERGQSGVMIDNVLYS